MFIVIAYDIRDDRRRLRISRLLEGYGKRVQYSVFECDLEERHLGRLLPALTRLIEPDDGVRLYFLSNVSRQVMVLAGEPVTQRPPFIIF